MQTSVDLTRVQKALRKLPINMSTKKKYGLKHLEKEFGALTFGRLLHAHRLGEDYSQVELAKMLGISKQSLNDLEAGRTLASIARAVEIAKKLGLMEAASVELAIQDQLDREGLNFSVKISDRSGKGRAA